MSRRCEWRTTVKVTVTARESEKMRVGLTEMFYRARKLRTDRQFFWVNSAAICFFVFFWGV